MNTKMVTNTLYRILICAALLGPLIRSGDSKAVTVENATVPISGSEILLSTLKKGSASPDFVRNDPDRSAGETPLPPKNERLLENYLQTRQSLARSIPKEMKERQVVGLSIALLDDQRVVWSQGFGYADKAHRIKATPETLYRAGSISKLFTATAAMQLTEQGRLDIDQPIQTYIPEFSIKTRFEGTEPMTLRQLMTHHSGLPSDYLQGSLSTDPESFAGLASRLANEYVAYPPNFILAYSNLGVSLLGRAVENACGKPFADCLGKMLLQPIGMTQSLFAHGSTPVPLMSKAYSKGHETPEVTLRDVPAGGLTSNVQDLGRFMQMVFAQGTLGTQSILKADSLTEMLRPQNSEVPLDLDSRIGLAWILNQLPNGDTTAWHNGSTGLFNSALFILPEPKLGVVVLANSEEAGGGLVNRIAIEALQSMATEKRGSVAADRPNLLKLAMTTEPLPTIPNDYVGYYASEYLGLVKIRRQPGHLRMTWTGESLALQPQALGMRLIHPQLGNILLNRADLSGRKILIGTFDHPPALQSRMLIGEKIARKPLSQAWLKRVGQYRILNPDNEDGSTEDQAVLRLWTQDGFLMASMTGGENIDRILLPLSDSEAIIAGLGRGLGETVRVETHGGGETLLYSGYVFGRGTTAGPTP